MLHATEKVVNLLTEKQQLISLVPDSIGDGPHNIVLPLERFSPVPEPGKRAFSAPDSLRINGYEIELGNARVWEPHPDWDRIRAGNIHIVQSAPVMSEILRTETPDKGINALLDGAIGSGGSLVEHFVQALIEPAALLTKSLKLADRESCFDASTRLAGLGTGLTPAGDDFISGTMMACWAGFSRQETLAFLPRLAEWSGQRTTRLSAAYLRSAAGGEFGLIWHQLLVALISGGSRNWTKHITTITKIGHNSGAYTLAGFLMVIAESDPS